MESTIDKRTSKDQFYKTLDEIIPKDLRKTLWELEKNPLWLDIGDYLNSIPIREKVDRLKLIDELSERTKKDYYELRDALNALESEEYIFKKRRSKPDLFLAPRFVEAMRIRRKIEAEVLNPMLEEMRNDPDFSNQKNLDKALKRALYSALQ